MLSRVDNGEIVSSYIHGMSNDDEEPYGFCLKVILGLVNFHNASVASI